MSLLSELPEQIPVFPLRGVLLLPGGQLSLNIFEPGHIAMVDDALKGERLIGMIQPQEIAGQKKGDQDNITYMEQPLYETGCAGRITSFVETEDDRYLITLTGVRRFDVIEELPLHNDYRSVRASWAAYDDDMNADEVIDLDRFYLKTLLQDYFTQQEIACDWDKIDNAEDGRLVTSLSMICPFEPSEKQALLEAGNNYERAHKFMAMLEMAVHENDDLRGHAH